MKGKTGSTQVHYTFYGEEDSESAKKRTCFKCGQEGHVRKDCSKKENQVTGGGRARSNSGRKPRSAPKHRKFHCAFHKDAADKFCSTWSCPTIHAFQ